MHHNHIRNEHGSSLVLVLLVTLIFTVLGLSLLSATVNGTKRTELREDDVQATYVAEKGVDEIVQSIQTDLRNGLGTSGKSIAEFNTLIDTTIKGHKSPTSINHQTGTSVAKVLNFSTATNVLRRVIEVESTGTVNGETETIRKTLEIGPNSVPDVLRYALGTYTVCQRHQNCDVQGEGNLFLHGGVSIQGDMKVDGNLITTDQGYASYNRKDYWIDTFLPTIQNISDPSSKAKMVLGGKIINFTHKPTYQNHINQPNFSSSNYHLVDPEEAFQGNDYPIIEKREPIRDPVDIGDSESLYKYTLSSSSINGEAITKKTFSYNNFYNFFGTYIDAIIRNTNMPNDNVYPYYLHRYNNGQQRIYEFDLITFTGNNNFKRFSTAGNLKLDGGDTSYSKTQSKNGIYVGNNLTIGNSSSSNNINDYDKLKVSGPFYVGKDLKISGANVEFNALIYVKGDVTIEYSVLKGLNENGTNGSLIVFAEGDINIRNNSLYEDNPSYIRGYFYSGGAFEMFGVGSNVNIDGGISARRIVLNAVKGKAKSIDPRNNQYKEYGDGYGYFQQKTYQENQPSRLKITYNPTIIKTYSDLKTEEPFVKNIAEPVPIERSKK
ncbi:hypothetical protein [Anaerobacillus sp. 1_MG-2023]|uniref:hypothetical protein n=1 Tax=Bacillales TaxID=1385 RepID=UPI0026E2C295|nr:hypothetical protein [Anaerobacillus sp. 1_MG-2023]MDO6656034.1 hypothetical protein [Anaerobacillus sp. 1_MG-2023]